MRTFTLLGLIAGVSGWLWTAGLTGPAMIFLAGLGALVVVAYHAASRTDIDGTTEVSAFVVLGAGVLAGAGYDRLASGIIAVTVLFLVEKRQLHRLVKRLDRVELRAGARFAIMAAVVLPLLPAGPFGPYGGVRPRQLWALVLFFSGLSFVGYLARRAVGHSRGLTLTGLLGGMVSSTSVTLTFSRLSHSHQRLEHALAGGVIGASGVSFVRVLIVCLVLAPALAALLWPAFVAPVAIALLLIWMGFRHETGAGPDRDTDRNPLQFRAAIEMAVLFQVVLFAVGFANARFGQQGLVGSAALLGLTDVDALTLSMSHMTTAATVQPATAAFALALGILVNMLVKLGLALVVGRGAYRWRAGAGLAAMAAGLGVSLYFLHFLR